MSNITGDNEGSFSSGNTGGEEVHQQNQKHLHASTTSAATNSNGSTSQQQTTTTVKKKRNLPGTPDPNADVIALSPTTLMATNRFVCEICNKGFQRDQNLQLHRRGHNLPWKLKQRTTTEVRKRVYICPEPTCVHHNAARALGDLTGIKKHFSRKHGEKKWKCDKCSKKYAVQSDWKAHQKTCGTREYKCDCGTIFSRRDSFITHRAFCDALAEENNKVNQELMNNNNNNNMGSSNIQNQNMPHELISSSSMPLNTTSIGMSDFNATFDPKNPLKSLPQEMVPMPFKSMNIGGGGGGMFSSSSGTLFGGPRSNNISSSSSSLQLSSNSSSGFNYLQDSKNGCQISGAAAHMSATALLQKAAQMGATASNSINSPMMQKSFSTSMAGPDQQLSPIKPPPSYGPPIIQQHNNNNNINVTYHDHQSNMVGINGGGFSTTNQIMQKSSTSNTSQEMSQLFEHAGSSSTMNDHMGIFTSMYNLGDQDSNGLIQQQQGRTATMDRNGAGPSRFGGSGDMMTLDLLGIGGSRVSNMHHQQQQQQQRLEMEAINQQRIAIMNPYQQQLSHGDSLEKQIWDV
ncbi:hypothetical protein Dsin_025342 [Dipteronia sinensis]|uniref:C2H2-type domain-containing protein n=1 Tax=Dipteronia sinensis TaxID=43782 RepID=A0AAD9ZVN2_9ROSI|nr:hypothetical protein Dsin_025342 [Dipteronia sinensis]